MPKNSDPSKLLDSVIKEMINHRGYSPVPKGEKKAYENNLNWRNSAWTYLRDSENNILCLVIVQEVPEKEKV